MFQSPWTFGITRGNSNCNLSSIQIKESLLTMLNVHTCPQIYIGNDSYSPIKGHKLSPRFNSHFPQLQCHPNLSPNSQHVFFFLITYSHIGFFKILVKPHGDTQFD